MRVIVGLLILVGSLFYIRSLPEEVYPDIKWLGEVRFEVVDKKTGESLNKNMYLMDGPGVIQLQKEGVFKYGKYDVVIEDHQYEMIVNGPFSQNLFQMTVPDYVMDYEIVKGHYVYKSVVIDIPMVYQKPELPNGCEITSLTSLMKFYDMGVTKLTMEKYLEKVPFSYENGTLYGVDPHLAFAGDPKKRDGWYCFEAPVIHAANQYFEEWGVSKQAIKESDILKALNDGYPIQIWTTLDMSQIRYGSGWYLPDKTWYTAIKNLHSVVVYGYDDENFFVMDPLEGKLILNQTLVLKSFEEMGKRGLIIIDKSIED